MSQRIYTIGHSNRSLPELIALLREHGIRHLADIRRFPGSKRHPHFTREALSRSLPGHRIAYHHFEPLGGHRNPAKDSRNVGLESDAFRGYADHTLTPEFGNAIEQLLVLEGRVSVMCAESVPWRCHRNILSDDLVRRGVEVIHILAPHQWQRHELNPLARIEGDRLVYEPEQRGLGF